MRKVLSILLLSILLAALLVGCGDTPESKASKEPEVTEVPLSNIVDQAFTEMLKAAKTDDFDAFSAFFDPLAPQEYIQSQFSSLQKYDPKENRDIEFIYNNDTSFAASIFEYTNLISGEDRKTITSHIILVFEKVENKWLIVGGEKLSNDWYGYAFPVFTDYFGDVVETGFFTTNHQILFNKVLAVNSDTFCKTAEFDENGNLQLTLSIINGLDNDIFDVVYKKLIISDVNNNVIADLSGYSLPSGDVVKSKTIANYTITVPASQVVSNPGNDVIRNYLYMDVSSVYKNRTN